MSSAASASGAKVSMFGAKSGFVIPKNKLSGSLVPVFQGGKSPGGGNTGNEYNAKQGQRKTKWGPDLTQDAAVKKGRALAYQKRVDQITQQLEAGTLEAESNRDSGNVVGKSFDSQTDREAVEHLELERREAIGEILKLNPRFKAPPDYKPLMKEARLPIPVKEYPDFNFLSLILGSRGDTQKRLEKETGAKIQIFGTKTGGGEKVEISPPEGNGVQAAFEELYVKISADTYDKVDAAVSVIELLITSVSGNLGAATASASGPGDTSSVPSHSYGAAADSGTGQPTVSVAQTLHSQFQQQSPWFASASNQTLVGPPLNPSAPTASNPIPVQQVPNNSLNAPSFFGRQPNPALQTASLPSSSQPLMQGPYAPESLSVGFSFPPRSFPMPALQASLVPQPAFSGPPPFSGGQIEPIACRPSIRFSAPMALQPVHNIPFRPRPLPDVGSGNMGQATQPLVPNFRPQPVAHQPAVEQQPPISFPSSIQLNRPAAPAPIALRPSGPIPVSVPSFPSINPPTKAPPRPLQRDFTFQPQQPNIIRTPQIPSRPSIQSGPLGGPFPQPMLQPPVVNSASRPVIQPFSRPQHFGRPMDQPQAHLSSPFLGNPRSSSPTFQNFGPPMSRMRPMNSPAAPQFPNFSATLPSRPVFRQTVPVQSGRPQNHHQMFYAGGQQVYDPFSPTDA